GVRIATVTLKSPERWLESVQTRGHGFESWETLDLLPLQEEMLMMGLRLTQGILREKVPFIPEATLTRLRTLKLLEEDAQRIRPTLQGRLVLTSLTAELLSDIVRA